MSLKDIQELWVPEYEAVKPLSLEGLMARWGAVFGRSDDPTTIGAIADMAVEILRLRKLLGLETTYDVEAAVNHGEQLLKSYGVEVLPTDSVVP
jgi:hypothetical protein